MRFKITLLFILIFVCYSRAQKSDLAKTPPMGWNSWNCFGIEVTEGQVKAVADYMAEHLKQYGWEYVVVDAGWYHPPTFKTPDWNTPSEPPQFIDEFGRLIPDTIKFPSAKNGAGFKPLADYIHSKGLKFGIHIMRGIPWNAVEQKTKIKGTNFTAETVVEPNNVCEWAKMMRGINMTHPAGIAYYQSIVDLYEEWGVDYIKADDMSRPYRVDEIHGLSKVLQNTGKDIVLSLSPGASPLMAAKDLREHANLWRISNDFWDTWESLRKMFDLCKIWAPYVTQNHWPDADMLPIGKLRKNGVGEWEENELNDTSENLTNEFSRLTKTEQYALMNLWAIFRSPLMIGGNLPENDEFTFSLITNEDLLEINQHSTDNRLVFQNENEAVWIARSYDQTATYLALFNLSNNFRKVKVKLSEIGLESGHMYSARNVWDKSLKKMQDQLGINLEPHASIIYKIER